MCSSDLGDLVTLYQLGGQVAGAGGGNFDGHGGGLRFIVQVRRQGDRAHYIKRPGEKQPGNYTSPPAAFPGGVKIFDKGPGLSGARAGMILAPGAYVWPR